MMPLQLSEDERLRGVSTLAISWTFISIAFLFVALRLYTRIFLIKNVSATDYKILAAWICALCVGIGIVFQVQYGSGAHMSSLQPQQISAMLKAAWFAIIAYQLGLGLTKCSILSQYMRIFPAKHMQITIKICFTMVLCYILVTVFGTIFFCTPVNRFWELDSVPGTCINITAFFYFAAAFNIITDCIIFVIPMRELRSLQMPRRQRIALMCVFGVGFM